MSQPHALNLLIAASEAIPYAKTGGLADVAGALPIELAKRGHNVVLLLPRYQCLSDSGRVFRPIAHITVPTPRGMIEVPIEEDVVAVGLGGQQVRVWAIRRDVLFDRPGLYGDQEGDYPDNLERFAFFCRAVIETIAYLRTTLHWKPDLLHLHDWQTALCAVYLKSIEPGGLKRPSVPTVLTLHNVGYQGLFPVAQFEETGLPASLFTSEGLEFYGSVNLLKGGLVFADYLTTVSPTYAKEILTPEFGFGLEGVLLNRQDRLQGILNGIDIDRWNPETDLHLPARYSVVDWIGKKVCKQALQREFQLPERAVPLLAVIARLTWQKGLDLVEAIVPKLMTRDLQLVILGTGDLEYEAKFQALHAQYPGRIGLRIGFDEGLAHRIEGGADVFVMPSRYEPCGLSQLYSLRYGTIPVVRNTGGLADTVVPFTPRTVQTGTATGFHVDEATADSLLTALDQALAAYHDRSIWEPLVTAGMKTDNSWARSAETYERLFGSLLGTLRKKKSKRREASERSV